ncbi:MAG: AmmeMemoRadiSam system protein A [Tissierellia bacterium]|nr:AmmeMemoRadiSam system protein A [Tissierellia bacterium]
MTLKAGFLAPHPPIIIKEIGKSEISKCISTVKSMENLSEQIGELNPDNIIIISPHGPLFKDAVSIIGIEDLSGSFADFGHPELSYKFKNNLDFVEKLYEKSLSENIPCVVVDENFNYYSKGLDHGTLVPLEFIIKNCNSFKLIPINYGLIEDHDLISFGRLIYDLIKSSEESYIVIASGDLSHSLKDYGPYDFTPEGPEFDKKILESIENSNLKAILDLDKDLIENAHQCGYNSLLILLGVLSNTKYKSKLHSYEGPFGVGYAVASFTNLSSEYDANPYTELARKSIEYYAKKRLVLPIPEGLPEDLLSQKAGAFVSIHKNGELRGCIGTIRPVQDCIAMEIIHNAISASAYDPRFYAVSKEELEELDISVDILMPPETIISKSDLDPIKYGVIVKSKDGRQGLLLPNLEGINTVDEQILIALKKAGISPAEKYSLMRFEVVRH